MSFVKKWLKKGDTLIEVTFAIGVFSLISVLSLQIMDKDLAAIQGAMELEMARNEIDAQAEAIRFIHNAYLSESKLAPNNRAYQGLWYRISRDHSVTIEGTTTGTVNLPTEISKYSNATKCSAFYDKDNSDNPIHNIYKDHAFVINTRKLNPNDINFTIIRADDEYVGQKKFIEAPVYPRLVFSNAAGQTNDDGAISENTAGGATGGTATMQNAAVFDTVEKAEGIWIIASRDVTKGVDKTPEFIDYHIRTCWFAPGHETPSILSTTIRLYNPDMLND